VSTLGTKPTEPSTERLSLVRNRRFTVAEYHKMIETGILDEDEHVELLEGEIVQMSPQEKPHARALAKVNRWLTQGVRDEYVVRPQLPLTLPDSEPEPDLAIVRADDETAAERHPRTALLVIEIADSSARYDLVVKSQIYAAADIPEYWIVLVQERAVEVLRDPDPIARSYRSRVTVSQAATLTPKPFAGPTISLLALFD
jgi:Uma2 family endonuclease